MKRPGTRTDKRDLVIVIDLPVLSPGVPVADIPTRDVEDHSLDLPRRQGDLVKSAQDSGRVQASAELKILAPCQQNFIYQGGANSPTAESPSQTLFPYS